MTAVFDEILRFNADRRPDLVSLKLERMDASVFAFFRGTDHLFAVHWPQLRPSDAGPAVLCSGDLHIENFGVYRTDAGDFRYDINDFDESLVAPCSFDLVRCTTSILLAAEDWRLSPLEAARLALHYLDQYRDTAQESLRSGITGEITPTSGSGPIQDLLKKTAQGGQQEFLDRFTRHEKHEPRRIERIDQKRSDVSKSEARIVSEAIEAYGQTTAMPASYRVLDVTGRIAGIGGLGVERYLVLIEGNGSPDGNRLLDMKEARPSSVLSCGTGQQPKWRNEADRVVESQRRLQGKPASGLAVLEIAGRSFRMREMIPEENRSKIDRFQNKPEQLQSAVQSAGKLTAWSHVRGCEPELRESLARWATGSALDAVLAAAVRFADANQQDYVQFQETYHANQRQPKRVGK